MRTSSARTLTLAFALAFASCSKSSDPDPVPTPVPIPTTSGSEHLTGGSTKTWKKVESRKNGNIETMDSCDLDDRLSFTKAGNAAGMDFGSMKCSSFESNMTGNWTLTNSDTKLTVNFTFFGTPITQSFDLLKLKADTLKGWYLNSSDTITETYIPN